MSTKELTRKECHALVIPDPSIEPCGQGRLVKFFMFLIYPRLVPLVAICSKFYMPHNDASLLKKSSSSYKFVRNKLS
jgi:hypothetical protein